jgi:hypothetical protein
MHVFTLWKRWMCQAALLSNINAFWLYRARRVLPQWMSMCSALCGASSTVRWCIYSCWDSVVINVVCPQGLRHSSQGILEFHDMCFRRLCDRTFMSQWQNAFSNNCNLVNSVPVSPLHTCVIETTDVRYISSRYVIVFVCSNGFSCVTSTPNTMGSWTTFRYCHNTHDF